MNEPKQLISMRVPAEELAFYRQLADDRNIPLTELIARALRYTYNPPIDHIWVCKTCGRSQTAGLTKNCKGTPGDFE